ncbi:MAG TPA: DolP-mannose mannosyltransferase [Blastocatellia bacterium]|nr:DolP-mannose mannosyltransferase [Blastocatellia bacterium]
MSNAKTDAQEVPARRHRIDEWLERFGRRRMFWVVVMVAALLYSQSEFLKQPSKDDPANWDYIAQVITRGGVPYRDVVNIKTPLSAYIGAAAIVVARPFGVRDLIAIRITFLALAALTAGFTFLVALDSFNSYRIAVLAASAMLAFDVFARQNAGGVQPKTPMVLFGLVALNAVPRDRPIAAGFFGMLSALSWQPGLLFVGAAGLACSRNLTSWRDLKAVKVLFGALMPFAVFLAYLFGTSALADFYRWTLHFNVTVYGPGETRTIPNFFSSFAKLIGRRNVDLREYFYLALVGLCVTIGLESIRAIRRGSYSVETNPRQIVLIVTIVYFAFCMISFQAGADLIPLLPFTAIFAAVALVWIVERVGSLVSRVRPATDRQTVEAWMCIALLVFILGRGVADAFSFERGFPTLKDQDVAISEIVAYLQPGEKIYAHGASGVLVLAGLTNASKYYYLDRGKDEYLDQVEPGGFVGWLERLKAERPKVVVLDRLTWSKYASYFEQWVAAEYQLRNNRVYVYYVRKDGPD